MPVSFSVTPTATSSARRLSLPPKASTPVPSSTAARRLPSQSATSSPSPSALRVRSSQTLRRRLVTVVLSRGHPATTPQLSATRPMTTRPAFVSPVVRRRPSLVGAVQPSASSPVVDVSTSLCSRLVVHSTSTRLSATSKEIHIFTFAPLTHHPQLASHSWCGDEPRRPSSRWW